MTNKSSALLISLGLEYIVCSSISVRSDILAAALLTLLCTNNHISLANGLTHKPDDKLEKAHIYLEKKEKNVKSRVGKKIG